MPWWISRCRLLPFNFTSLPSLASVGEVPFGKDKKTWTRALGEDSQQKVPEDLSSRLHRLTNVKALRRIDVQQCGFDPVRLIRFAPYDEIAFCVGRLCRSSAPYL